MIHTYDEAVSWIHSRLRLGIKPGLKRMEWILERLNNPERNIKAIHVAGTNGKGSTVCYLRNILQEAGYSVGTFTSPYIEVFNERISVDGTPITDEEIIQLVNVILPLANEIEETELGPLSEFEAITAMAFYYFGTKSEIDYVIFEVGLGGRFDSTNVVLPILSIITNIGYDHMDFLGETLPEIAFEKAGIIKENIALVTTVDQPEAVKVITKKAEETNSLVLLAGRDFVFVNHESISIGEEFSINTQYHSFENLRITMKGPHQVKNAALAVAGVSYLIEKDLVQVNEKHIKTGLEKAKWIGRFEQISSNPMIIIDGAHNPEGIESLVQTVKSHLNGKKIHIIFSALKDKKLDNMIDALAETAESITFTSFDYPRVCPARELFEMCTINTNKQINENWQNAIEERLNAIKSNDVLLVTGSLYFVSEVRAYFVKK